MQASIAQMMMMKQHVSSCSCNHLKDNQLLTAFPVGAYSLNAMTLGTGILMLTALTTTSEYTSTTTALPPRTALTVSCQDHMLSGSIRKGFFANI